jgi:hypothetical protein
MTPSNLFQLSRQRSNPYTVWYANPNANHYRPPTDRVFSDPHTP